MSKKELINELKNLNFYQKRNLLKNRLKFKKRYIVGFKENIKYLSTNHIFTKFIFSTDICNIYIQFKKYILDNYKSQYYKIITMFTSKELGKLLKIRRAYCVGILK